MYRSNVRFALFALILISSAFACNLPFASPTPDQSGTRVAATLSALETDTSASQTAAAFFPPTSTPAPTITSGPGPTAQQPTMLTSTLCWLGPGPVYEVSSAVQAGAQVDLIGRGSNGGWWIIKGPIYHDPCWIMADTLQIPATFNTTTLQVYYPPATATPTPTDTPTLTPTP